MWLYCLKCTTFGELILRIIIRPIVTDEVASSVGRSVCLSVCHTSEPCKNGCIAIEMPYGLRTRVGPGNHVLDGGPDPHAKGNFTGKGCPIVESKL